MKQRIKQLINSREKLVASFGRAQLVQMHGGRVELRGGGAEDQTSAKEWISLFMHEAVVRPQHRPNPFLN